MDNLLNELARLAKCSYISDLPIIYKITLTKKDILNIVENDYTLNEWNEVLRYLTRKECYYETATEAKEKLIRLLK